MHLKLYLHTSMSQETFTRMHELSKLRTFEVDVNLFNHSDTQNSTRTHIGKTTNTHKDAYTRKHKKHTCPCVRSVFKLPLDMHKSHKFSSRAYGYCGKEGVYTWRRL